MLNFRLLNFSLIVELMCRVWTLYLFHFFFILILFQIIFLNFLSSSLLICLLFIFRMERIALLLLRNIIMSTSKNNLRSTESLFLLISFSFDLFFYFFFLQDVKNGNQRSKTESDKRLKALKKKN